VTTGDFFFLLRITPNRRMHTARTDNKTLEQRLARCGYGSFLYGCLVRGGRTGFSIRTKTRDLALPSTRKAPPFSVVFFLFSLRGRLPNDIYIHRVWVTGFCTGNPPLLVRLHVRGFDPGRVGTQSYSETGSYFNQL